MRPMRRQNDQPSASSRLGGGANWNVHKQANVLHPWMFMAQLPQIPSLQLLRNVSVGSISFLTRISASRTMGPVWFRSNS